LVVERREKYSQRQKQNRRDHGITKFSEQKKMGGHCSSITLHIMLMYHQKNWCFQREQNAKLLYFNF
jgi:hypothetical protein